MGLFMKDKKSKDLLIKSLAKEDPSTFRASKEGGYPIP
jgi:hypothetical protein